MQENDHEIDDLLENFEFKPITEGLGFHHSLKDKKEVKTNLKAQSDSLKNELKIRTEVLERQKPETPSNKPIHRGDLAPFYESTNSEIEAPTLQMNEIEDVPIEESIETSKEATLVTRSIAWLLDCSILIVSMAITIASIIYFAELPLDSLSVLMVTDEILTSFLFISLMYYLFYFLVLDKTSYSTLGKNIMGIKVIHSRDDSKRVSLLQTLSRAVISILSIPLLGLPTMLDFHSKLTDTKVISKN